MTRRRQWSLVGVLVAAFVSLAGATPRASVESAPRMVVASAAPVARAAIGAAYAVAASPVKMSLRPPVIVAASLCDAYTPSDVEWWFFMCYLQDPPKDPRT